jgi:hypothetical protein
MVHKQLTLKQLHSLRMIRHLLQSADLAERTADMDERDRLATQQRNLAENLRLVAAELTAKLIEERAMSRELESEEALSIGLSDIEAEAHEIEAADPAAKSIDIDSEISADVKERIRDELEDIREGTGQHDGTDND